MRRGATFVIEICALAVAALLALSGCKPPIVSGALPVSPPSPVATKPSEPLNAAIGDFGLDLLQATAKDATGNVILSPASVHAALSMTVNGATGETAQQMRDALHVSSTSAADVNRGWAELLNGLGSRSSDQTLETANSLWARKGIPFKQPFLDANRLSFSAQIATLDFRNDDVVGAVNGWASKSTHGMIDKILDRVPVDTLLYLANAVYFKGQWVSPFEHESTGPRSFTRGDGVKVVVDMMHKSEKLPYAESGTLQATKLAYKGGDTSFYVLLPKPGVKMDAALASLKGRGFLDLRASLGSNVATQVILAMPKLDAESFNELSAPLKTMGMHRAFDRAGAQFSGIAEISEPLYISAVLHKTKVKVDELGTEAAAVTVVEVTAGAAATPRRTPEIICDRPYLFAIVDEKSGAMLFLGEVNDPRK
jgi:serine protease inhibitor